MRALILIGLIASGSVSYAGSRHLYCNGQVIQMDIAAKGAHPVGETMSIRLQGQDIETKEMFFFDDNGSHDFHFIYQSIEPGINLLAVLERKDQKIFFSVSKEAKILEKIDCFLGF